MTPEQQTQAEQHSATLAKLAEARTHANAEGSASAGPGRSI
jgi:hypothetical protein